MTTYTVTVEPFIANGEQGLNAVEVEAESVEEAPDWVVFYRTKTPHAYEVVATFPRERVISVVSG